MGCSRRGVTYIMPYHIRLTGGRDVKKRLVRGRLDAVELVDLVADTIAGKQTSDSASVRSEELSHHPSRPPHVPYYTPVDLPSFLNATSLPLLSKRASCCYIHPVQHTDTPQK